MTYISAECIGENRDDRQRNCPKHVEFLDENKFGKLVRLLVLLKRNFCERFELQMKEFEDTVILTANWHRQKCLNHRQFGYFL